MTKIFNKKSQAIILIVVLSLIAVAGLLMLMGQMAAPKVAATDNVEPSQPVQSVSQETSAEQLPFDSSQSNDEIVATINEETIFRQTWRRATRLDAVMSQLAFQPVPTAEETLDRLVNEILVLDGVDNVPSPTEAEVIARVETLATIWNVSDEAMTVALQEAGLSQGDLTERVSQLIQVEAALNQLTTQEEDITAWLTQARASAEIGLYRSLAANAQSGPVQQSQPPQNEPNIQDALVEDTQAEDVSGDPALVAQAESELEQQYTPPADIPISPYPENAAPDFDLPQLNDDTFTLSNLRGKPTIINFWATWCPPCRRELPALQDAYTRYGDKIGFVAVDVKENKDKVSSFVKELNLTFPVALDQDGRVSDAVYQVRGLPTTIFIDANGVVAARHVGPLDESSIDSYLAPLLEPPSFTVEPPPAEENSALSMIGTDGAGISVEPGESENNTANDAGGNEQELPPVVTGLPVAPDFALKSATDETVSLQAYRDQKNVVLVFYRGHT